MMGRPRSVGGRPQDVMFVFQFSWFYGSLLVSKFFVTGNGRLKTGRVRTENAGEMLEFDILAPVIRTTTSFKF
jgi:hypothetical protein